MKLGEFETFTGYQGKISKGYEYRLIKMKDVDKEGSIDYYNLDTFNAEKIDNKYVLKEGDIIIKTKCSENTAAIIEEDFGNMVATSHFTIIRVKDRALINPYYLLTYINSSDAQGYFKSKAIGTVQSMISKGIIDELDIKIIDMESQENLGEMHKLIKLLSLERERDIGLKKQQMEFLLRESLK